MAKVQKATQVLTAKMELKGHRVIKVIRAKWEQQGIPGNKAHTDDRGTQENTELMVFFWVVVLLLIPVGFQQGVGLNFIQINNIWD